MDFTFNEEQQMFRQMFADFVSKEIEPLAEHIDADEAVPDKLLEKAAMQGFLGALLPEDFMGAELDPVSYVLMLEEVAKACMSTAMTLHIHNSLVTRAILLFGDDDQKERWLPDLAEGAALGSWAGYEPDGGGLATLQTKAAATSEGATYRLKGVKAWVSNAGQAGLFAVTADSAAGPTVFLVPAGVAGLKVGSREKTLGMRGMQVHTVYLDDVKLEAEHVLGRPGQAAEILDALRDFSRLSVSAIALGGAEHALDLGIAFAIERSQFGTSIANKGAIQGYIADSTLEIETLRSQLYRSAALAEADKLDPEAASITKLWANRVAYRVADRMIQTHGGYGYINEYAIGRVYRDCRTIEGVEGSNQSQQRAIARSRLAVHGFVTA